SALARDRAKRRSPAPRWKADPRSPEKTRRRRDSLGRALSGIVGPLDPGVGAALPGSVLPVRLPSHFGAWGRARLPGERRPRPTHVDVGFGSGPDARFPGRQDTDLGPVSR